MVNNPLLRLYLSWGYLHHGGPGWLAMTSPPGQRIRNLSTVSVFFLRWCHFVVTHTHALFTVLDLDCQMKFIQNGWWKKLMSKWPITWGIQHQPIFLVEFTVSSRVGWVVRTTHIDGFCKPPAWWQWWRSWKNDTPPETNTEPETWYLDGPHVDVCKKNAWSSSSPKNIWNQGFSYLIYWLAWEPKVLNIYCRELEDQGICLFRFPRFRSFFKGSEC